MFKKLSMGILALIVFVSLLLTSYGNYEKGSQVESRTKIVPGLLKVTPKCGYYYDFVYKGKRILDHSVSLNDGTKYVPCDFDKIKTNKHVTKTVVIHVDPGNVNNSGFNHSGTKYYMLSLVSGFLLVLFVLYLWKVFGWKRSANRIPRA